MRIIRSFARIIGAAAIILLLLLPVSASAADSHTIDGNAGWSGRTTNMDWKFDPDFDFDLDFSSGKTILGFIPVPTLKMSVTMTIGVTGSFDLDLKQANLPDATSLDTRLDMNTAGLYREKISNNIFDYLPSYYGIGFDLETVLLAGATRPVQVKGNFENVATVIISLNDIRYIYNPTVEFTSIRPKTTDETLVFVGVNYKEDINIGEVGWRDFTIGPILKGTIGFMSAGKAEALLSRDQWAGGGSYLNNSISSVHSCTENGKDGCVSGDVQQAKDIFADVKAELTLPIIDYEVFSKKFPISHSYSSYGRRHFVQSLTWKENLKYQQECSHWYYKVPVAVWANKNMTIPLKGIYVHHDGYVSIDSNMSAYAYAKTGSNPTIPNPDREGKVNLYLPYKEGKYTIIVDRYNSDPQYINVAGRAEMPSGMRRGANDRVNIILESSEKVTHSVRKNWDIDFENNDKPESVDVLLQAQYYNTGYFSWEGVQKATLSSANNWSFTFDPVPRYEMNAKGEMVEIKYRVRELKEAGNGAGENPGAGINLDMEGLEDIIANIDVIQNADGLFHPDNGAFAAESKRVVPSRWDLDNTHVWEVVKKKFTDWTELWQINPSEKYLKDLAKAALFPEPSVSYTVPEYTTIVGDHVDGHKTKYRVTYEEEGNTTTITNTAVLDFSIYKRWIMLGDAEEPDSVFLCLNYRLDDKYREYAGGGAAEKFIGMWIPVINPVGGNKLNILSLAGLDILAKLDVLNKVSIPIAIGEAKKGKDGENPLVAWRVKFTVKKYGWLGIPGLPVEFQAQELSSTIVTDLLKFLTGLDIPISFSLNPFSGDKYITVPGFPICIPYLDKEWEYTCNVINTWAEFDDDDDLTAIGGTKYWVNDREEDRPDSLTIVVKDEDTEIGRVTLSKNDYEGQDSWVWALKSNEVNEGITLDSKKTYTVTEEYPDGYAYREKYVCNVIGHDLTNTWTDRPPRVALEKVFVSVLKKSRPSSVSVDLNDGNGTKIGTWNIETSGDSDKFTTILDKDPGGNNWNPEVLASCTIANEQFPDEDVTSYDQKFDIEYSGPIVTAQKDDDGGMTPVYTYTVTNTIKGNYQVTVKKIWEDEDPDSRPDSVDYVLVVGERRSTASVEKSKNWIEKFYWSTTAEPTELTLEEVSVPGYESTVTRTISGRDINFVITNTVPKEPDTVTVKGTKTWDDDNNAGGTRPAAITIRVLTGSGPAADTDGNLMEKTVSESDGWAWEFSGLPRCDAEGSEIAYSVIEFVQDTSEGSAKNIPVPGYTVSYADPVYDAGTKAWTCDITNSTKLINVFVQKKWQDSGNETGLRPGQVTVRLSTVTEDTETELDSADLNEENNWTWLFRQLPAKDENDREITWSVTEDPVDRYNTEISSASEDAGSPGFLVTNSLDENYINIPVSKVWQGDEAFSADRPDRVTVHLYNGDEELDSLTIYAGDGWKGRFKGYPKKDDSGNTIAYSLKEDRVSGYDEGVVTGSAAEGFTVTNTFSNTLTVTVRKQWDIYDDSDIPTGRVPFMIYQDDAAMYTTLQFLYESDDWTKVYEGLPKYDSDGQEYRYSVKENSLPSGYTVTILETTNDSGPDFTIINRQTARTVSVTKQWDDEDNERGLRPEYVTVHLLADGERVMNDSGVEDPSYYRRINAGSASASTYFMNMPVYRDDGKTVILYTVEEDPVDGYLSAVTGNMSDGFTISNTLVRDAKSVTVTKVWKDDNDAWLNRPDSVTVRLLADGEEAVVKSMTADDDGNWSCVFAGLPVYRTEDTGVRTAIVYTVSEDPVPGYDTEINGFTITNTLCRFDLTVRKIWEDDDDTEGLRPDSVFVEVYLNGTYYFKYSVFVKQTDSWTAGIHDMPVYMNGEEILYEIREESVPGYISRTGGSAEEGFVITNTLNPRKTDITVTKEWISGLKADSAVTVILLSDREKSGEQQEIARRTLLNTGSADDWTVTFKDQPIYAENERVIKYTIQEEPLEEYGDPYYVNNKYRFTIQNWKKDSRNITVKKTWEDENDAWHNRPDSITVRLLADGTEAASQTLTAGDGGEWSCEFTDLPVYKTDNDGNQSAIEYTVSEDPVPGYDTEIDGFRIINTLRRTSLSIRKVWEDNNDVQKLRPESVFIELYINGTYYPDYSGSITPADGWTADLRNLPVYMDGRQVLYEIKEKKVPEYTTRISGSADDGFVITNTLTPRKTDITVTKEWISGLEKDSAVTVILLSDRETPGEQQEVSRCTMANTGSEDDWTITFKDQPIYTEDDRVIQYSVQEEPLEGYGEPYYIGSQYSFTVRNWSKAYRNVAVQKTWENDTEENRPDSVTVRLLGNGTEVAAAELTAETGWETVFENLDRTDEDGREIVYTVTEDPVKGYSSVIDKESVDDLLVRFTVTNTYADYAITYDPNKGTLNGSTEPVTFRYPGGTEITILDAPVREGYEFRYWKGSRYQPGDKYTVTEDHTFTAQWQSDSPYSYKFTFTKKWSGDTGDGIEWTLYKPDGTPVKKKFNRKVVSDTEWLYEAWFSSDTDYYLIETPPEGYRVRYENTGIQAGETDRCYNGGTIINSSVPHTGDKTPLGLWIGMVLLGLCGIVTAVYMRKKK